MFTGSVRLTAISNEQIVDMENPVDVQTASVHPCPCDTDNNIAAITKDGLSTMSPRGGIQTMQTPTYDGYTGRNDNALVAIAALGFISLGLIGLAFFLSRRRD
jgi:hypothetical protein